MSEKLMDLGSKVLIAVISLLLGVIMTLTFQQARYAVELAHANEVRIKALEISTANIKEMLNEIRADVKKLIERTSNEKFNSDYRADKHDGSTDNAQYHA